MEKSLFGKYGDFSTVSRIVPSFCDRLLDDHATAAVNSPVRFLRFVKRRNASHAQDPGDFGEADAAKSSFAYVTHELSNPLSIIIGKVTEVGLAYCHRTIAAIKGQFRPERTASRGATFAVELPLAVAGG